MANKPVQEIRLGRIKAAIWENQTESGPRHNVTVTRLYKDGDEWKSTDSFGRDDLPLVAKAVDLAHTWIYTKTQEGGIAQMRGEDAGDRGKRSNGRPRSANAA